MHAFLVIGSEKENIEDLVNSVCKKIDAKLLPFTLQKIDDVRNLKSVTRLTFNQKTAILLKNIDTTSEEALNALLKELEEPSDNLYYILTANNLNNVLPTIISRCEVIKPSTTTIKKVRDSKILDFLNSKIDQKLEIIGKIKEREEAIKFINDLIFNDQSFINKECYLQTLKNLNLNGNVSLQLTNLLVKMNSHG